MIKERPRALLPTVLVGSGLLGSVVALLDPPRLAAGAIGLALCAIGLALAFWRNRMAFGLAFSSALAGGCVAVALAHPDFAADSHSYYVYLRSAYFDHDLDFANEWERWGFRERRPTETGRRPNVQSIGPAVLWSPFYLLADGYVAIDKALLGPRYPRDGDSPPYHRALALGTLTIALLGSWALYRLIVRSTSRPVALLAVGGAVAASPIVYYVLVMPAMSHGVAFGLSAALLWACDRVRRRPSTGAWLLVGLIFGLLVETRWQAVVCGLLIVAVLAEALWRRRLRPRFAIACALAAFLGVLPQLVAWKILYGRFLAVPQGSGFFDWRSPHFLDTLLSADHGLFSWTPLMLLAFMGTLLGLHRGAWVHGTGIIVLLATAWVNGAVVSWAGGDAFGARRFDLWIPFAALGLAVIVQKVTEWVHRSPGVVSVAAVLMFVLWNAGLIVSFREQRYPSAAPIDRVAGDQGRNLRRAAQSAAGWIAGPRGRALAYKYFSGEYLYENYNPGSTINLAAVSEADLGGGWSPPRRKPGGQSFRWALYPTSCVRIPLQHPIDLRTSITVRAPGGAQPQHMTVIWNGSPIETVPVGTEWSDARLILPAASGVAGENFLCLQFANAAPGEDQGARLAAAVARIQLP